MGKKTRLLVCLGIFIIVLGVSLVGFAGTVGNPASPDTLKGAGVFNLKQSKNIPIETGVDVEILFDRDIKGDKASSAKFDSGQWYMAKIAFTMFDRIEPYVKLGAAHLEATWKATDMSDIEAKLESDTGFAWGLGAKALIWDFKQPKIKLISDGFYRVADLDGHKGKLHSAPATIDTSKSKIAISEWQIALLAATEIDMAKSEAGISKLVPYIGVKYSDMRGALKLVTPAGSEYRVADMKADNNFGIVVGTDLVGSNDSFSVNLEGRFIDETAMTIGLAVLF